MKKKSLHAVLLLFLFAYPFPVSAVQDAPDDYIFSKIDHQQGLSNSAVICVFKDDSGLMWFGTYDGVNCFDGRDMETFRADFSKTHTLDNNVIYGINQADGDNLWFSTLLGVNRFSRTERQVVANYTIGRGSHLFSNSHGDTWIVGPDSIAYYNTYHGSFIGVKGPDIIIGDTESRAFVTEAGDLCLFPESDEEGNVYRVSLNGFDIEESSVRTSVSSSRFHHRPVRDIFYQNNVSFCFVDADKDLYMYDIGQQTKVRIRNIGSLLEKYGHITGIVPFYDDFIIAFRTNGLMRLKTAESYREEMIDHNLRVFYLYKDPVQGILWIGVDGKGAMMYAKRHSIATNLMMHTLSPNFTRQVRSIMTDKYGGLWFGTKGDGLIYIKDYAQGMTPDKATVFFPGKEQTAGKYTREDTEFPVFSLLESRSMDGFWVGSGAAGLFYYTFGDGRLYHLPDRSGQQPDEIHEIYEANDTTLYIATAGSGFCRVVLDRSGRNISMKERKQYRFFHKQQEISTFFSIQPEGDSVLWLGSRERGLVRFNTGTDEYQVIPLREKLNRTVDDVLCICMARSGDMFVGTTAGLVRLKFDGYKVNAHYTGREQGLLNDMIHGILEDVNGSLWLSTNKGLIKYNPDNGSSHAYYYTGGVQIREFSDDAYYKCPYTGRLFFGGVDGLLYIDKALPHAYDYYPEILLRKLSFGRNQVNLADYYTEDRNGLRFKYTYATFTLTFAAPDFISGADMEYSWMLEGYDKDWQESKGFNEASYSDVPVGDYVFKVRYRKDIFGTDFKNFSIPLRILPLWYQTVWARLLFAVLAIAAITYFMFLLRRFIHNKRMLGRLLESESKSLAMDNAACREHEIVGGLTAIYRACDYLRAENTTYEQRGEKIEHIRENVMSLLLPTDIFRNPEADKFSPVRFTMAGRMCLKAISDEVMALFKERGYDLGNIHVAIPDTLSFPVYRNAFRCFFYYIYMFMSGSKRTGALSVHAVADESMMTLTFRSGRSILKKLQESLTSKEYVHHMSSMDPDAVFGIHLLHRFVRAMMEQLDPVVAYSDDDTGAELSLSFHPAVSGESAADKKSVLLLGDHDEILWLVNDILSEEYVVHQVKSIQSAFDSIKQSPPAVFLVDMMIYADTEDTFMEFISRNGSVLAKTTFIPLLTWKASSSIQRKLVLMSDTYIVLPYDIIFLKEVVHKAIYGRKEVKQIYVEGLGDFANLVTCTTREQVEFIRKMVAVVEENIDREDLGSTFIAEQMAMSPRQFYRKFKEISGLPPTELIKNYRMEKAAVLLLDNELSIQDVITEVGISSRSYFYKEFTRKFGMTPKDYREMHCNDPVL